MSTIHAPQREAPTGPRLSRDFMKKHRETMIYPEVVDDPARIHDGKINLNRLAQLCFKEPARFEKLVNQGLRADQVPGLVDAVIDAAPAAGDLDVSLGLLKRARGKIDWLSMRRGARHMNGGQFLTLLKHGPECSTTSAADTLAGILAENTHLIKDTLSSRLVGNSRGRVVRAILSINPEAANLVGSTQTPAVHNPLLHRDGPGPSFAR